ncbi:MBL fold metallo-hydrolase [Rhizobium leguminosarum]
MQATLHETILRQRLADCLKRPPAAGLMVHWLGQAGFVIDMDGLRLVIDPYLSDSLAEKYRGTARPHKRMMPPPIGADEIVHVDLVLCTHTHTDHMDPGTLPPLLSKNPGARLVVPRADAVQAKVRSGLHDDRLVLARAGERLLPLPGLEIVATRAAHERLETDADGNHRFLGYTIRSGRTCLWHSGDCIPFDGLEDEIAALRPDIALLPVNGRRPELSQDGVPGNFTLDEAIAVARRVGAADMIAHHYGLFDFNTEDPARIDAAAAATVGLNVHRARTDVVYASHL